MLVRAIGALVVALVVAASGASAALAAEAGPMRAISGMSPFAVGCGPNPDGIKLSERAIDSEVEPSVAVNPRDPRNIVVAWMQDYTQGLVVASTRDGGQRWAQTVVAGTSTCSGGDYELAADPWLVFDAAGTAYLSGFSLDIPDVGEPVPFRTRWEVRSSSDGGLSWSAPVQLAPGEGQAYDRPAIVADPRTPGLLYAIGIHMPMPPPEAVVPGAPSTFSVAFLRSPDGGRTWSLPRPVHVPDRPIDMVQIDALPDGSLVAFAGIVRDDPERPYRILAYRSEDRGDSWSQPITVADVRVQGCCGLKDPETGTPVALQDNFLTAVAPDGTLYVTYRDLSDGDAERSAIRLVRSTDGGRSWVETRTPARALPTPLFLPAVAVAGDGTLGVTYYDVRRDVPGDGMYSADLWIARSRDGGRSWVERHLAGSFDLRRAMRRLQPLNGLFVGDYYGLEGLPRGFALAAAMTAPVAPGGPSDIFFGGLPSHPS